MKALYITAPNTLDLKNIEEPKVLNPTDIKIKVSMTGVCGSDIHFYHGKSAVASYPKIAGHEMVGNVLEVGSKVSKHKVGDKVVVQVGESCGHCYACKKNRPNACRNLKSRGAAIDGVFAEYLVVDERSAFGVNKKVVDEDAVLIEPYTIAAQVCMRGAVEENDTVLIIGSGAIGLMTLDVVKHIYKCKTIITDIFDEKLNKAKELGADFTINTREKDLLKEVDSITNGEMANVVIDTACVNDTFDLSIKAASSAGRVVVLGFIPTPLPISQLEITKKELTVAGSRQQTHQFEKTIKWMEDGLLHPKLLISDIIKSSNGTEAFKIFDKPKADTFKVVVDWRS